MVASRPMPVLDRQLAGNDGGLAGRTVVDDLQQIAADLKVERGHAHPGLQPSELREVHGLLRRGRCHLCAGLPKALDYFGGVPEHVLFDNTKVVLSAMPRAKASIAEAANWGGRTFRADRLGFSRKPYPAQLDLTRRVPPRPGEAPLLGMARRRRIPTPRRQATGASAAMSAQLPGAVACPLRERSCDRHRRPPRRSRDTLT